MVNIQHVHCVKLDIFAYFNSSVIISCSFICEKCLLFVSQMEKVLTLELRIQTLKRISDSENNVMSVRERLDVLGGVIKAPTLTLSQSSRIDTEV